MIEPLRRAFNASWSEAAYASYKATLAAEVGAAIPFRICETPVFLPAPLQEAILKGAHEIWSELLRPENLEYSKAAVPPAFDVPGCDAHPLFAVADFAVVKDGAALVPRLIELQAFPSLYAFQFIQSRVVRDRFKEAGRPLEFLLSGLDEDGYLRMLGEAILGGLPQENVVLMDIDPEHQSTYPDFAATEKLFGVRSVCPTKMTRRGRELYYDRDGRATRILRIYNRMIVDELVAKKIELPFRLTEPLDVQWAGHPNWFFRWSKHALPRLRHPLVPEARLLSEGVPEDLESWVLKPLFSFSGTGVVVDLTPEVVAAVPLAERGQTLLMRKVDYAPAVETADGQHSRVEVRILFIWRSGRPQAVITLARLSQGKMMGVKYNKDKTWVGSSACLWPRT
jgi:hypothetical protein